MCITYISYCGGRKYICKVIIMTSNIVHLCPEQIFSLKVNDFYFADEVLAKEYVCHSDGICYCRR